MTLVPEILTALMGLMATAVSAGMGRLEKTVRKVSIGHVIIICIISGYLSIVLVTGHWINLLDS